MCYFRRSKLLRTVNVPRKKAVIGYKMLISSSSPWGYHPTLNNAFLESYYQGTEGWGSVNRPNVMKASGHGFYVLTGSEMRKYAGGRGSNLSSFGVIVAVRTWGKVRVYGPKITYTSRSGYRAQYCKISKRVSRRNVRKLNGGLKL